MKFVDKKYNRMEILREKIYKLNKKYRITQKNSMYLNVKLF